jgi:hypothetical protein
MTNLGPPALSGYTILKYKASIYGNLTMYFIMTLFGLNISLNSRESLDWLVTKPLVCEVELRSIL